MGLKESTSFPALWILCFLHVILPCTISAVDLRFDGQRWCDGTPYPGTCGHHVTGQASSPSDLGDEHSYYTTSLQAAMDLAVLALAETQTLPSESRHDRAGPAWFDCRQLMASAVRHLNRTAVAARNADAVASDMLAWLSAARTSLDTCLTGFAELSVSPGPAFPSILSNLSRLVTNALAVTALWHETVRDVRATTGVALRDSPRPDDGDGRSKFLRGMPTPGDADVVVAKDGTGHFWTVGEALKEAASRQINGGRRIVVYVKAGVYDEYIEVWTSNLVLLGDGIGRTVITGNRSVRQGYTTFSSATFAVNADGFVAYGVTFRNTAGSGAQQAVALRASADRLAFYRCSFEGHQDTLYAHTLRHFYRECVVAGTVDFVFGNAAAVLQQCSLRVRRPLPGQPAVVTAQGRTDRYERTGFAIHGGRVAAATKFGPGGALASFRTYLGRPWKEFSRVVYMEAYMDGTVDAAGWLPWDGTGFAQSTAFYGEYKNSGPGSDTSGRVRWGGYHVITDPGEASEFTAGGLVDASSWLGSTGVPFTPGL